MSVYIKDIAYYLPNKVLTNGELLLDFPEWSCDKVFDKLGIKERHIAASSETVTDMAARAAENLFAQGVVKREDVDFILLCTQSPEYYLPSSACLVQSRLGLSTRCGALDFNLGCSGYEYGLALAKGLIVSKTAKNVLLITAEQYTKYLAEDDKGNRTIFGDGASATLVSISGFAEIGESVLGTDGSGAKCLIAGKNTPFFMDGPEILNFSLERVPQMIEELLDKNNMKKEDVSLFVLHQANQYILRFLQRKLKVDDAHFYYCLEHVGNTVSSTIPIALCEARKEGRLKGNVLLAGFGVGLSWGAVGIRC